MSRDLDFTPQNPSSAELASAVRQAWIDCGLDPVEIDRLLAAAASSGETAE